MLEKIKHNKIKNTGLIYQILVRKMIQQATNGKKPTAYNIFNNFFSKDKALGKQLAIYNLLTNTKYENKDMASSLFEEALDLRMKIDDIRLDKQKYYCIKQIKKHYRIKPLFQTKVDNYKVYASIYKVFESLRYSEYNPLTIVQSRHHVLDFMLRPLQEQSQVDSQDMKLFREQDYDVKEAALTLYVQKFNQKFAVLNESQKQLLKKYTYTMTDNTQLDGYMNKEIDRLHQMFKDDDNEKVQQIFENVDKIKSINNIQDKLYSVLNLYEIENITK